MGEDLDESLERIRKAEKRINNENEGAITKLNEISRQKKALALELRSVIDTVKKLDFENKKITNELTKVTNTYDEKMKDLTGGGHLARLKHQLFKIRKQGDEMSLQEGAMQSQLYSSSLMRQG